MAAENTITYTLEAKDLTTATLARVGAQMDKLIQQNARHADGVIRSAGATTRWQTQIDRLTTSQGIAYEGLRRFNSLISGTIWGIAAGAVAVLTTKVVEQVKAWSDAQTALDTYHASLKASIDLAKRQEAVTKLLEAQTEAQVQLKEAQAEANALYGIGTFAQIDLAQSRVRRLQADLDNIRRDLDAIDKSPVQVDKTQEQRGADIAAAARKRWDEAQKLILARSTFEVQIAEVTAENVRRTRDLDLADDRARANDKVLLANWEQDQYTATVSRGYGERDVIRQVEIQAEVMKHQAIMGALAAFQAIAGKNSKALFLVSKALYVAQAVMAAHAASVAAAAATPGDATAKLAAGALVLKWGLANAAVVAATQLAQSFSGGGGGGGGDSGSTGSSVPASAREIGPSARPIEVNVTIHSAVTDQATLDRLGNELRDSIGRALENNGGRAGNLQISTTRL